MKRPLLSVAVFGALFIAWSVGRIQGQQEGKVVFVDSAKANYTSMPQNPNVSMAPIWGDASAGAHATFTKFKPGYDAGMHTHTNDVWIVVIKGAYLYKDEDGEKRVGPGDFASPEATSTGAAATRKKARCFMKKDLASLTSTR